MGVGRKAAPVGAHYGLRDWLAQRASAVVMLVAAVVLFVALVIIQPDSHAEWRGFILSGWVRLLLMLTVVALVWHAFIGARDIFMDYLKNDLFRLFKIFGVIVYLLACLLWAVRILL